MTDETVKEIETKGAPVGLEAFQRSSSDGFDLLYGSQYPGSKIFNKAAFIPPPPGSRAFSGATCCVGFGAWQTDFAVQRQFHLIERLGLRFRAEFFNIFNDPNYDLQEWDTTPHVHLDLEHWMLTLIKT
jgi:hypothetical protein